MNKGEKMNINFYIGFIGSVLSVIAIIVCCLLHLWFLPISFVLSFAFFVNNYIDGLMK